MIKNIRRTKEEIAAGLTLAQKKDLANQALVNNRNLKKNGKKNSTKVSPTVREEYDPDTKTVYKYKTRTVEKEIVKKIPVVKEVRILNGTKGTKQTVAEIMAEEMYKCSWEWKEVDLDKNFRSTLMKDLGKKGWKMVYVLSWRYVKDAWKNKADTMFFQRPKFRR